MPPKASGNNNPNAGGGRASGRGSGRGRGHGRGHGAGGGQTPFSGTCHGCGQRGHKVQDCPGPNTGQDQQTPSQQQTSQPPAHPLSDALEPRAADKPSDDAQAEASNPWVVPGTISNTGNSPEQLVIQTAVDAGETSGELLDALRKRGYQTDIAQIGRASTVLTNFLSIEQRPIAVFVYDIAFTRYCDKNDNDKPVLFTRKFDKEGLFAALRQTDGYDRLETQSNWVTDCTNIWSTTPLFHDVDFRVVPEDKFQVSGTNPNSERDITAEKATVIFNRIINLQNTIGQIYGDSNGQTRGSGDSALLQRGLNAMISKYASEIARAPGSQVMQIGANKFYDRQRGFPLDSSNNDIGAMHGFFISVRPGAQQLLVNINLRCSPFLRHNLEIGDVIQGWDARKATSILKGVKVRLTGSASNNHQYQGIEFITDFVVNNNVINVNVGGKQPAARRLMAADSVRTFTLSPWRQPLSPVQTSAMIGTALKLPSAHVQELTHDAIRMFGLNDPKTTKHLRDCFGLVVHEELMEVPCRFLETPGILYSNPVKPRNASWNLAEEKLRGPCNGRTVQVLDMSILDPKVSFPANFESLLHDALRRMGIGAHVQQRQTLQVLNATVNIAEATLQNELDRIVGAGARDKTSLIVVIPKRSYDLYSVIKRIVDPNLGIQSTCVVASNLRPFMQRDRPKSLQHAANIGLKLNLKGDGHNHVIARNSISELYKTLNDGEKLEEAECNTIVIGADVTHPMGHCAPGCPSIAAVVGSVDDDFAKFPGSMRLQRSKTEVILQLHDMVKERLLDWAEKHHGELPGSMLFYRDGVSESQFDSIRTGEIEALQQAYDMADAHIRKERKEEPRNSCYPFKLTFIVVGKRHNTRFFPVKGNELDVGRNGNVTPGLVVDQVITHPYASDFYLQSHQPIQGTGRSAHYFVLCNNLALSSDSLQRITHAFCYNYARATKGVSYCGPAYYADRLCDRGRAYIRDWLIGRNNVGPSRPQNNTESADGYQDFVANELYRSQYYRPHRVPHKYGGERKNPWHPNLDDIMFYL